MTTTLTRRRARERDRLQPSLFSQVVAPPAPRREEARPEPPHRHVAPPTPEPATNDVTTADARTLDETLSALWGELTSGTAIDCPVCGGAMEPRHSAGAGVVGGRCNTCATTLS